MKIEICGLSQTLRFLSRAQFPLLCTLPRSRRGRDDPRQDQDEIGPVCARTGPDQANIVGELASKRNNRCPIVSSPVGRGDAERAARASGRFLKIPEADSYSKHQKAGTAATQPLSRRTSSKPRSTWRGPLRVSISFAAVRPMASP